MVTTALGTYELNSDPVAFIGKPFSLWLNLTRGDTNPDVSVTIDWNDGSIHPQTLMNYVEGTPIQHIYKNPQVAKITVTVSQEASASQPFTKDVNVDYDIIDFGCRAQPDAVEPNGNYAIEVYMMMYNDRNVKITLEKDGVQISDVTYGGKAITLFALCCL